MKDFPARPLAELGVTISRPDDYLCDLANRALDDLAAIVIEMAADRTRPKLTPLDVLDALVRAGVPNVVERVRPLLI